MDFKNLKDQFDDFYYFLKLKIKGKLGQSSSNDKSKNKTKNKTKNDKHTDKENDDFYDESTESKLSHHKDIFVTDHNLSDQDSTSEFDISTTINTFIKEADSKNDFSTQTLEVDKKDIPLKNKKKVKKRQDKNIDFTKIKKIGIYVIVLLGAIYVMWDDIVPPTSKMVKSRTKKIRTKKSRGPRVGKIKHITDKKVILKNKQKLKDDMVLKENKNITNQENIQNDKKSLKSQEIDQNIIQSEQGSNLSQNIDLINTEVNNLSDVEKNQALHKNKFQTIEEKLKKIDEKNTNVRLLENLSDQISEHVEVINFAKPPSYNEIGRGLVYNCKEKHWACVNRKSYFECRDNKKWDIKHHKKLECFPRDVYESISDCIKIQKYFVNMNTKTNFCYKN